MCGGLTLNYLHDLKETEGMARATIARRLSTVASFYRYCVDEELIGLSPAVNVKRPKVRPESTMTGLDRNELGLFLVEAGLSMPETTRWGVSLLSTDYECLKPWVLILVTWVWNEATTP